MSPLPFVLDAFNEELEAKLCRLAQIAGTHKRGCAWCEHVEAKLPAALAVVRREVIAEVTRRGGK